MSFLSCYNGDPHGDPLQPDIIILGSSAGIVTEYRFLMTKYRCMYLDVIWFVKTWAEGDAKALKSLGRVFSETTAVILSDDIGAELLILSILQVLMSRAEQKVIVVQHRLNEEAKQRMQNAIQLYLMKTQSSQHNESLFKTRLENVIDGVAESDVCRKKFRSFTPAQEEVLDMMMAGKNLSNIAAETGRSIKTVSAHKTAAMKLLDAENEYQLLTRYAWLRMNALCTTAHT